MYIASSIKYFFDGKSKVQLVYFALMVRIWWCPTMVFGYVLRGVGYGQHCGYGVVYISGYGVVYIVVEYYNLNPIMVSVLQWYLILSYNNV